MKTGTIRADASSKIVRIRTRIDVRPDLCSREVIDARQITMPMQDQHPIHSAKLSGKVPISMYIAVLAN